MSNDKINADKLAELWDNGFENDNLDPGDIFNKTIEYCYELERKISTLESKQKETENIKTKECSNCGKIHEYSALSCYDKIGRAT